MMIISNSDTQQDTVRLSKIVIKESVRLKTYSLPEEKKFIIKRFCKTCPVSGSNSPDNETLAIQLQSAQETVLPI